MENQQLTEFMSAREWLAAHPNPFFPTQAAFDWFAKRHRRELVERGALIPGSGRAGSIVNPPKMAAATVEIFTRRSTATQSIDEQRAA